MKAITIRPAYALAIIRGLKRCEFRSWQTHYRGPLVIHAADTRRGLAASLRLLKNECGAEFANSEIEAVRGRVLGTVEVVDMQVYGNCWAWCLANPRVCAPVRMKGKLGFWNCPEEMLQWR